MTRFLRLGAALAIVAALGVAAALMLPHYWMHLEFQRRVERVSAESDTATQLPDVVRTQVMSAASDLGLPVRADQVSVERSGARYRVRVLYVRRVDLGVYTVDLHFRSATGE